MNFAETSQQEFPNGRRKREILTDDATGRKYEKYVAEVIEVGNVELNGKLDIDSNFDDETFDDEFDEEKIILLNEDFPKADKDVLVDTSGTRWLMYDGLARLLQSKGLEGRQCVLRSICEAAETKFTHHSGIFGELFHILFT